MSQNEDHNGRVTYGPNSHPTLSPEAVTGLQSAYLSASRAIGEIWTQMAMARHKLANHDAKRKELVKAVEALEPVFNNRCRAAAQVRLDLRYLQVTRPFVHHESQIEDWFEKNPTELLKHRSARTVVEP